MGLLSMMERRSSSLSNPDRWLIRMFGGERTKAGVDVDEESALSSTAVFAAVRLISETLASVPLKLYERMERGKKEARGTPVYRLLHDEPNEEQTPMGFREMLQGFVLTGGNGYAQIVRDGAGRPVELWPLIPPRVKPERSSSGALYYRVRLPLSGQDDFLPAEDVLHVSGFTRDGLLGMHVIDKMREAIATGMAMDQFTASFFGNNASPGGLLITPNKLSPDARKNLRESWEERHKGPTNNQKVALLEEGLTWQQVTTSPKDSLMDQLRVFQILEVARIFNVPPHLLREMSRSTFSNIEHQLIEFITLSMRPWYVRWEQTLAKKLLLPSQRDKFIIEHTIEGLLRGDIKTRYEAYAIARQNGAMSANDWRELENQNPVEGGDEYLVQLNMVPSRLLAGLYESKQESESSDRAAAWEAIQRKQQRVFVRLATDAASRGIRAATGAVRKLLRQTNGGADQVAFRAGLDRVYEEIGPTMRKMFTPVCVAVCESAATDRAHDAEVQTFAVQSCERIAREECAAQLAALRTELATRGDIEAAVSALLDEWEESRAAELAERVVPELAAATIEHLKERAA